MEKRIVPLITADTEISSLPDRLRRRQAVLIDELETYARQALIRIDTAQLG